MFIFADSGTSGQLRLINPQIACVLMLGSSLFVATWHSPSHGWWSRNEMGRAAGNLLYGQECPLLQLK